MTMQLATHAFPPGGRIPARYTCEGDDVSPPLSWSGAPPQTRSFALVCADPDAPGNTWYHWAVYDIPASIDGLAEGFRGGRNAAPQARNDFTKDGYGGPCPPHGHGVHHYRFKLFALPVAHLELPERTHCRDVEKAATAQAIATAELIGTYSRKSRE